MVPAATPLNGALRDRVVQTAREAQVVACISPKDAETALLLCRHARSAVRYFQSTGLLPADATRTLAAAAHAICCNATELVLLAEAYGLHPPAIDETEPSAEALAAEILGALAETAFPQAEAVAVTLGRRGLVLADLQHGRTYLIQPVVRRGFTAVPTRSGTRDTWPAAWIYEREVRQTTEPDAATNATWHVAAFLGLQPDQFNVRITRLSMPVRRTPAGQQPNGPPFSGMLQPDMSITAAGLSPSPART